MPFILMDPKTRTAVAVHDDTYLVEVDEVQHSRVGWTWDVTYDSLEHAVQYGHASVTPLLETLEYVVEP